MVNFNPSVPPRRGENGRNIMNDAKVVVVTSSRLGVSKNFFDRIKSIEGLTGFIETVGITDVALARNTALTEAIKSKSDIVLMLDDDMHIDVEVIDKLVKRVHNIPLSAYYCDANGDATFSKLRDIVVCGLGCLAIPMPNLKALAEECITFKVRGKIIKEFTSCRCIPVETEDTHTFLWLSEDYTLTKRLGGVSVQLDLKLGHNKIAPIFPKDE